MPPVEVVLEENAQLKAELSTRDARIAELEAQIAWFRRQMFAGGKSEKIDARQLELLLQGLEQAKAEAKTETVTYERKAGRGRRGRDELYENLPVKEEKVVVPEEVEANPESYERIGETETFEVCVKPPSFHRRRIVYPKFRSKADRSRPPIVAPAPPRVVEGVASRELLAHIVISKYLDHLPLHRQRGIFRRHGFTVAPQNLVRWVEKVAEWLKPIYNHMRRELLEGDYLQVDETPIRYCDPDYGERKSRQGQLCGFSRPGGNVCYKWSLSRSHDAVTAHFGGFEGVLQSDAYDAYIKFEKSKESVSLAACWAHARRKFFDIKDYHPRECALYLTLVARLYAVEAQIREGGLDAEAALKLRREKSLNTHARIRRLLLILSQRSLPGSSLGKACAYSLRIWQYLSTYLEHGRVAIDNNAMENAIRPTAIGKKNWLFVGHPQAGERAAIIYSVLISCQRLEIDPSAYLNEILSVDTRTLSEERLATLTPSEWKKSSLA